MKTEILVGAALLAVMFIVPARADIIFAANGTGVLTIVPGPTPTSLHETIDFNITTTAGPELDAASLSTLIDTTATSIATTLYDAHFLWTGPNGNALFGTYNLLTDDFSSAVDETFTGEFDATGGTGAFSHAYGPGSFSGANTYADPTLSAAVTTLSVNVSLAVPEPGTLALFGVATLGLAAIYLRRSTSVK